MTFTARRFRARGRLPALMALVAEVGSSWSSGVPVWEAVGVAAVRLKITLRGVRPPVWRRVVVPASFTLAELHSVLQTAMGWTDSHLHSFDIGGVLYGDVEEFEGKVGNETRPRLSSVARRVSKFRYEYDFGDGWEHTMC
jgi:Plasmid pRiA4b ORF-3-like protein